jgi:hypothetical protein
MCEIVSSSMTASLGREAGRSGEATGACRDGGDFKVVFGELLALLGDALGTSKALRFGVRGSEGVESREGEERAAGTSCGEGGRGILEGSIRWMAGGVAFWSVRGCDNGIASAGYVCTGDSDGA